MTARFYLELYAGDIPTSIASQPSNAVAVARYEAKRHQKPGVYWAVLLPRNAIQGDLLACVLPAMFGASGASTHGNEPLPSGTSHYLLDSVAVLRSHLPPYIFDVTLPAGEVLRIDPPPSSSDDGMSAHELPVGTDGVGIWVVELTLKSAAELPRSIGTVRAQLNPRSLPTTSTQPFPSAQALLQPLLRIDGTDVYPKCASLDSLAITPGDCAPGLVHFHAQLSGQAEGIISLNWDFADGTTEVVHPTPLTDTLATLASRTHTYQSAPTQPATITLVRDPDCGPTPLAKAVVVPSCVAPPIQRNCPTLVSPLTVDGCAPGTVNFIARFAGNGAEIERVSWEFREADGHISYFNPDGPYTSPLSAAYTYQTVPAQSPTVTLINRQGCSPAVDSLSEVVPACRTCPVITGVISKGCTPGEVNLAVEGTDLAAADSIDWDFNDGSPHGTGRAVTHVYTEAREYHPKVTVVALGCRPPSQSQTVTISPCVIAPPPRRPWYCAWLEAVMMIALVLAIVTGLVTVIEGVCGARWSSLGGAAGIAVAAFVLVVFELLVSQFLTFAITATVAGLLWIALCRPTRCRVLEDLAWCFQWAVFFITAATSLLLLFAAAGCVEWGLYPVIIGAVTIYLTSEVVRSGCHILNPFSLPWLRAGSAR